MIGFVSTPFTALRPSFSGTAVVSQRNVSTARWTMAKSKAMPFADAPDCLPEGLPGYAGFDPLRMSENMNQDYMRAAELKNGRVAMLGSLGMLVQSVAHLPNAAYSKANPIDAIYSVPVEGMIQIIAVISILELATFKTPFTSGANYGFDPLGLGKNGAWADAEVYNARLAMLGSIGLIAQTLQTGKDPISQLQGLF